MCDRDILKKQDNEEGAASQSADEIVEYDLKDSVDLDFKDSSELSEHCSSKDDYIQGPQIELSEKMTHVTLDTSCKMSCMMNEVSPML